MKKMLITTALPYANGPLHIGHLVEYTQADIWARFQRMRGNDCLFVCADDAHGTPIMISAEKQGISPEELIDKVHQEHAADFKDFHIKFDNYYTTHSPENRELSALIYQRLHDKGDIEVCEIEQAFDPEKNMFLPDRYVKGTCPKCGKDDQYGDNCENCGATYDPTELKNPKSVLSGATPILKKSEHYFFKLEHYHDMLKKWIHDDNLQPAVTKKLMEWFESGLQSWDISRDEPYFGFEIPNAPGKYFYVWMDAPIGYMASFKNLCNKNANLDFDEYWQSDKTELYHFIGKDIVYFHALFWPAMLSGANFRTPTSIFAHGFLTVDGKKMSKSRGTFITARQYLDHLDPEYLRYYFAAKLGSGVEDIDLSFDDFSQRVNSDVVGKVVNIASRCAGFITKRFEGQLAPSLERPELINEFIEAGETIAQRFHQREFNHAIRDIMTLADKANQYIDEVKPWVLAKEEGKEQDVQNACTMGINLFKILMTYLKPVLPVMAEKVEAFLNIDELNWDNRTQILTNHTINTFKPLTQRIQPEQIEALKA